MAWLLPPFGSQLLALGLKPTLLGSIQASPASEVIEMVARDGRLYILYPNNLLVFDEATSQKPKLLGGAFLVEDDLRGFAMVDRRAWVSQGGTNLLVFDLSNPADPRRIASHRVPRAVNQMVASGKLIFAGDDLHGVTIYDAADPARLTALGSFPAAGTRKRMVVTGDRAYVSSAQLGLLAMDVHDPASPRLLWSDLTTLARQTRDLLATPTHLLTVNSAGLLQIIRNTEAGAPAKISELRLSTDLGLEPRLAQSGNQLLVTSASKGFWLVHIGNPAAPEAMGLRAHVAHVGNSFLGVATGTKAAIFAMDSGVLLRLPVGDLANAPLEMLWKSRRIFSQPAIRGNLLALPIGQGVTLYDIGNPGQMRKLGGFPSSASNLDLGFSGDRLCVMERDSGTLKVYDTAAPSTPRELGRHDSHSQQTIGFVVADKLAHTLDSASGYRVFDIGGAAPPTLLSNYTEARGGASLLVSGDLVAIVSPRSSSEMLVKVLGLENPKNPIQTQFFTLNYPLGAAAFREGHLYVGAGHLRVHDVRTPQAPRLVAEVQGLPNVEEIQIFQNWALIRHYNSNTARVFKVGPIGQFQITAEHQAHGSARLLDGRLVRYYEEQIDIFQLNAPENPQIVGTYLLPAGRFLIPGQANGLALRDNYLYVADPLSGLRTLDCSRPTALTEVDFQQVSRAQAVELTQHHALVAASDFGMQVFSLGNLAKPERVKVLPGGGERTHNLKVQGNYAYEDRRPYDGGAWKLLLLDVSDPLTPVTIGYSFTGTDLNRGVFRGNRLFAPSKGNLLALDFNPFGAITTELQLTITNKDVVAVAIADNFAYAAVKTRGLYTDNGGIQILDLSNFRSPKLLGSCPISDNPQMITVEGDYAYLTHESSGLVVVDIKNPAAPRVVGGNSLVTDVRQMFAQNGKLWVAAGTNGVMVLSLHTPLEGEPLSLKLPGGGPNAPPTITVAGLPGLDVEVQRSADLRQWTTWTNLLLPSTRLDIPLDSPGQTNRQFFRAVAR